VTPYYADEAVTLYFGDCREISEWLAADVLMTDPPYGRGWRQGRVKRGKSDAHPGIANDHDTSARDAALTLWGARPAVAFGDFMLPPPVGTKQTLAYRKAPDSGGRGAMAGFRRDLEAVYLIGPWPSALGGRSSLLTTTARLQGTANGLSGRHGHPHAKPVDVMEQLIKACPPGVIADPFAGSGSTLVAARNLGRKAIGVELEERYCETIAKRLAQGALPLAGLA
jgi:hypothetical protein